MSGSGGEPPGGVVTLRVNGVPVKVATGSTIIEACDAAGEYVPRLCTYPVLGCCSGLSAVSVEADGAVRAEGAAHADLPSTGGAGPASGADVTVAGCRLCAVRPGDHGIVLACATPAETGMQIVTDDSELRALRLARLRTIIDGHPFVCVLCPDRDGCSRDQCTYGNPPDSRCCDLHGSCELGRLLAHLDQCGSLRPGKGPFERVSLDEGPIRREPGLCVGCGRCVLACNEGKGGGRVLHMVVGAPAAGRRPRALPRAATLRESGCTFCGRCVIVCPAGALTASGEAGVRWLERRRRTSGLASPVLPPQPMLTVAEARSRLGADAGVLLLFDAHGEVVLITGVPHLAEGLERALGDLGLGAVEYVTAESEPLYTQRETELLTAYTNRHGHLPRGNDLGDDLFGDEDDL